LGQGEFALVRQELEAAFGQSPEFDYVGDHDVQITLADVAGMQRDEAAIRKYAPIAEELAIHLGHRLYHAVACRAWGVAHCLAGNYAQADARLQQALELFSSYGARWQVGRTHFELGELGVARGDRAAARVSYAQALVDFEFMRAAPDAARTRAAIERLGAD
jgi:hypothetical protein